MSRNIFESFRMRKDELHWRTLGRKPARLQVAQFRCKFTFGAINPIKVKNLKSRSVEIDKYLDISRKCRQPSHLLSFSVISVIVIIQGEKPFWLHGDDQLGGEDQLLWEKGSIIHLLGVDGLDKEEDNAFFVSGCWIPEDGRDGEQGGCKVLPGCRLLELDETF